MYLKRANVRDCNSLMKLNTCKSQTGFTFLSLLPTHPKTNTTTESILSYRGVTVTN